MVLFILPLSSIFQHPDSLTFAFHALLWTSHNQNDSLKLWQNAITILQFVLHLHEILAVQDTLTCQKVWSKRQNITATHQSPWNVP
jgi:hypothetical protein